jgi:hypothetical protein
MEPGQVDEHDGVRSMVAEIAVGLPQPGVELRDLSGDVQEPHHGMVGERIKQPAAGGFEP